MNFFEFTFFFFKKIRIHFCCILYDEWNMLKKGCKDDIRVEESYMYFLRLIGESYIFICSLFTFFSFSFLFLLFLLFFFFVLFLFLSFLLFIFFLKIKK